MGISNLFSAKLLLLLPTLVACNVADVTTERAPVTVAAAAVPTAGTSADRDLAVQGEQAFASRLYGRLPQGQNAFFSPTSIRMALSMTYAGARGETAKEMEKTLDLPGARIHEGYAAEMRDLTGGPQDKETVRIVNRLWGAKDRSFKGDFLSLLQRDYGAPLVPLDFQHDVDHSRETINTFIAQSTEQKIKDLVPKDALPNDTRLVLTNAVYFKAGWATPFDPAGERTFYGATSAPMMQTTALFRYGTTADAQVLELPYASGHMSMMIVLPTAKDGLAKIEAGMNDGSIGTWDKSLANASVQVTLPKFKITSELRLAQTLAQMGMPSAFDERHADFSGMDGAKDLFIGDVIHKAFIAVDEKGTEAAAATAVTVSPASAIAPVTSVPFVADHPYLFVIRDTRGAVLFMGRVSDPTKA